MKKASSTRLAFYLLLFTMTLAPTTSLMATPPGPPNSGNAPLPAVWVLAAAGAALGIQRLRNTQNPK